MFSKKYSPGKPQQAIAENPKEDDSQIVKYPQPRILLVDIEEDVESVLRKTGLNIATGSFGTPYRVSKSNDYQPVIPNGHMPSNYTEQEIVIVDLTPKEPLSEPSGEKLTAPGTNDWWASCETGIIDPRPRVMTWCRDSFDRILDHGGIFIIFADARKSLEQVLGFVHPYGGFVRDRDLNLDNWMFLLQLESHRINITSDRGEIINVPSSDTPLGLCLAQHTKGTNFVCTFRPIWNSNGWVTLATNKFEAPVAGVWILENQAYRGLIFLFPKVSNRPEFVSKLISEVLPEISPALFPHYEGAKWVQRSDYEIPQILDLKNKISAIEKQARSEINEIEESIIRWTPLSRHQKYHS